MAVDQAVKPKSLRIKVVDHAKEGRPAVNINMPISVVKWGMKMAQAFSPEMKDANVDWASVTEMIEAGEIGKLVEVEDEAQNKTVEIWVE
jgi:hypothetical protein